MSAKINSQKTAEDLAWEFIWAEWNRQYHEPMRILERMTGAKN